VVITPKLVRIGNIRDALGRDRTLVGGLVYLYLCPDGETGGHRALLEQVDNADD